MPFNSQAHLWMPRATGDAAAAQRGGTPQSSAALRLTASARRVRVAVECFVMRPIRLHVHDQITTWVTCCSRALIRASGVANVLWATGLLVKRRYMNIRRKLALRTDCIVACVALWS